MEHRLELHLCPEQMALLRRELIDVFGRHGILTVAIFTLALLTVAALTVAILTVA